MVGRNHIRNPAEWAVDQLAHAGTAVKSVAEGIAGNPETRSAVAPEVRRIGLADLGAALARGLDDTGAYRTDVFFLCLVYPVMGVLLIVVTFGHGLLQLLFPMAAGFALLGPIAAVGLYEMSRRRERGLSANWWDAFGVVQSRAFGAIAALGLV